MNRRLVFTLLILLSLQIAILLVELDVLPRLAGSPWSAKLSESRTQVIIGRVRSLHREVKKKYDRSIVWNQARAEQVLYAKDSILSLEGSSAELELKDNIHIKIHENTLIVLQLPEKGTEESLRLGFERGSLRSRLQQRGLSLESGEWNFMLSKNSEIGFRGEKDGELQVEISKGELQIQNSKDPQTTQSFQQGQWLQLNKNKQIVITDLSEEVAFEVNDKQTRFYAFPARAQSIRWRGSADLLKIFNQRGLYQEIELSDRQQSIDLELPVGHYSLRLMTATKASKELTVEIRQPEDFRYYSPLPRERKLVEESQLFSWQGIDSAQRYRIQWSAKEDFSFILRQELVDTPYWQGSLPALGAVFWRVEAIDDWGIAYPATQIWPVYLLREALPAPELSAIEKTRMPAQNDVPTGVSQNKDKEDRSTAKKKNPPQPGVHFLPNLPPQQNNRSQPIPETKKENPEATNSDGRPGLDFATTVVALWKNLSVWWQKYSIVPPVMASELAPTPTTKKEIYRYRLNWSRVFGADYYLLEVSRDPNFLQLLLDEKVEAAEYLWESPLQGKVYWRVAAASKDGKMGLYSLAAEVDLASLEISMASTVASKEVSQPTPSKVSEFDTARIASPELTPKPSDKKEQAPSYVATYEHHFEGYLGLGYVQEQGSLLNEPAAKYRLQGLQPLNLAWDWQVYESDQKVVSRSLLWLQTNTWQARQASQRSFQEQEQSLNLSFDQLFYFQGPWAYGLNLLYRSHPTRRQAESLKFATRTLIGFSFLYQSSSQVDAAPQTQYLIRLSHGQNFSELFGQWQQDWKLRSNWRIFVAIPLSLRFEGHRSSSENISLIFGFSMPWRLQTQKKVQQQWQEKQQYPH